MTLNDFTLQEPPLRGNLQEQEIDERNGKTQTA